MLPFRFLRRQSATVGFQLRSNLGEFLYFHPFELKKSMFINLLEYAWQTSTHDNSTIIIVNSDLLKSYHFQNTIQCITLYYNMYDISY